MTRLILQDLRRTNERCSPSSMFHQLSQGLSFRICKMVVTLSLSGDVTKTHGDNTFKALFTTPAPHKC